MLQRLLRLTTQRLLSAQQLVHVPSADMRPTLKTSVAKRRQPNTKATGVAEVVTMVGKVITRVRSVTDATRKDTSQEIAPRGMELPLKELLLNNSNHKGDKPSSGNDGTTNVSTQ